MSRHSESFIAYLQELQTRDRGAMAALRRSVARGPGDDPTVYSYVERFAGTESTADDPRRLALYLVAGLFARHPMQASRSFAAAFGDLAKQRGHTRIETRFVALLEADAESIATHLRHAVSLLEANEIGFDYVRLLDDLSRWFVRDKKAPLMRTVRQHWTRAFYCEALDATEVRTDGASFVSHLIELAAHDRAALAALRQSLAFDPGDFPKACPLIEPLVDPQWLSHDARRRARYLVAGVFALNPIISQEQSLAAALGAVARQRDSESIEDRFVALMGADAENIADHLRQAARLVAADGFAYNPAWLLSDLSIWLNSRAEPAWMDRLRRRWARDFYRAVQPSSDSQKLKTETEGA
ncbi:type I-E CRISPR-associated protein Cse2/CasB [Salinisphaera orenii]|uniref:type I-E CRISPR-associated protein Cse2/CasB n=1 Tax=Salinisphaera orenii TaxID=856731 RepID=UPI0019550DA6